jgi:thioredoxin 1
MIKYVENEKDFKINEGVVLVDFYADWCGPCKMMSPVLEKIQDVYPDITVLKVNTDNFKDISVKEEIMNIPTLDLYENGVKKMRKVGYIPAQTLMTDIDAKTPLKRKV